MKGCSCVLVRVSIAVRKPQDLKQIREERVYLYLQCTGYTSSLRGTRTEIQNSSVTWWLELMQRVWRTDAY